MRPYVIAALVFAFLNAGAPAVAAPASGQAVGPVKSNAIRDVPGDVTGTAGDVTGSVGNARNSITSAAVNGAGQDTQDAGAPVPLPVSPSSPVRRQIPDPPASPPVPLPVSPSSPVRRQIPGLPASPPVPLPVPVSPPVQPPVRRQIPDLPVPPAVGATATDAATTTTVTTTSTETTTSIVTSTSTDSESTTSLDSLLVGIKRQQTTATATVGLQPSAEINVDSVATTTIVALQVNNAQISSL